MVGIDCYETCKIHRAYHQAYENNLSINDVILKGKESKEYLEKLYKTNTSTNISLEFQGVDKYGRALGILYFGDTNINNKMLELGGCMKYEPNM